LNNGPQCGRGRLWPPVQRRASGARHPDKALGRTLQPLHLPRSRDAGRAIKPGAGPRLALIAFASIHRRQALWMALTVLGAIHLRHALERPSVDLIGLAVAAFVEWAGGPGPGEPVLIADGISAAHHHVQLAAVVAVAWAAATAGGIAGWWVGIKAGRTVLTTRGPLLGLRRAVLRRGDRIFKRAPVIAILLTPSWVAGIHGVPSGLYNTVNVLSAVVWSAGIGVGSYFAGPPIVEFVSDLGLVSLYGLLGLIAVAIGGEILRRRRRGSRGAAAPGEQSQGSPPAHS
jgi:membrane protein DedA with SNARE-associated domain